MCRRAMAMCVVAAAVSVCAPAAQVRSQAAPTPVVPIRVPVAARQIAYDARSNTLFASVAPEAAGHANSVVPIDASSGAVGAAVLTGGEPNQLAISDDGTYLYVGLDAEHAVARVDLHTRSEDQRWGLGLSDPPSGYPPEYAVPLRALDIDVMPGRPDVVAVARYEDYGNRSVAVFDNGVRRAVYVADTPSPDDEAPIEIEFSSVVPGRLYGSYGTRLFKMAVDGGGVSIADSAYVLHPAKDDNFAEAGGLLFDGFSVVDGESMSVLVAADTGASTNATPMEVDPALGLFYVLGSGALGAEVRAYSTATGLASDSFGFRFSTYEGPDWAQLESIGAGRLAVATRGSAQTMYDPAAIHLVDMASVRGAAGEYTPLTPSRIVDTRLGVGVASPGPLGSDQTVDVQIAGRGGVPDTGVLAVVVNATAVDATAPSYLTVWPAGTARPVISSLNYAAGATRANLVTVALGSGGRLSLYNERGTAGLVLDVVGFYATATGQVGSRYRALAPSRVLDTRAGSAVPSDATIDLQVVGRGGVPSSGVTAVALNVTAVSPTGPGYVTAWPADVERPTASNVNFGAGQTVPNLVVVRVPASGRIHLYNFGGDTHLLADVAGYYTSDRSGQGGRFVQVGPRRLFDTRVYSAVIGTTIGVAPGVRFDVRNVLDGALGAYVVNVTATDTRGDGFVTLFPLPGPIPDASNLNYAEGVTVPNAAIVASGSQTFGVVNSGAWIHLIGDVFGGFTRY